MTSAPIHVFLELFLPVLCTIFFSEPLVAFPPSDRRDNGQLGEIGTNSVAMIIINSLDEIGGAGDQISQILRVTD